MTATMTLVCQICFDDISQLDDAVTQLCDATCPAMLCKTCLVGHLSSALQVSYVGALPRVRCPICLVPLHKSQWSRFVDDNTTMTSDRKKRRVLDEYTRLCRHACSFQSTCCHDPTYVHLPEPYRAETDKALVYKLPKAQIPMLRRKCRQFGRHRITSRDLITYIMDAFPDKSDAVFYAVLVRIADDERRATLMLSYHHAVDRAVRTTCCNSLMCFNCKRSLSVDERCSCETDDDEIDEACELVQCRSCRATLIKVEGCDAVQCPCGFDMDWSDELVYRRQLRQQLLPVDPFDTTGFDYWVAWRRQLSELFDALHNAAHVKMQLQLVTKTCVAFVPTLRQFVWWRRVRRLHRDVHTQRAIRDAATHLVLAPRLRPVLRRCLSHRRAKKLRATVLAELRWQFIDREITKQRSAMARISHAASAWVQRRVVEQQQENQRFWEMYTVSHEDEQCALQLEEQAFVMQFNVRVAA